MELAFSLSLTLACSLSFAQSLDVYIRYYDRESIIEKFNQNPQIELDTSTASEAELTAYLSTSTQRIQMNLAFDTSRLYSACIYQKIIFDCTCANHAVENLLGIKAYRWIRFDIDQYVSKYPNQIKLNVSHTGDSEDCLTLTFSYIDKPKKEYKSWYRELRKEL